MNDRAAAPARPSVPAEDERRLRAALLQYRSALCDPVTGLCSYHLRVSELQARLEGRRLGIVVLEFPGIGAVEAAHGWEATDRLLSGVTRLLEALRGRALPPSTLLALDGVYGNSFLLFQQEGAAGDEVNGTDLARTAAIVAGAVRARLASAEWCPPGVRIDFSVGYALVCASPSARFERLLHQGVREAREMTQREADRVQGERATELRTILREVRLTTHYQPIVDMEQGSIMGYEALTRGPVDSSFEVPEALFALSDAMRLTDELDALCRRQAVRNARGLDPGKKLFLNALPGGLEARGFASGGFLQAVEETALQPNNLVLEISERTGIDDFDTFTRDLGVLRRAGFLVAIDDVGTGHSSLQAITEIQPDFLKIDMSLIKNLHQSLIKQELVYSLLQVSAQIGARVIAEGIETAEEFRTLRASGVRYGQGFYFARPAPAFATHLRHGENGGI